MVVLLLVRGNINVLGDMYAFGLLGAFTLTCLGMDIVRYRDRRTRRSEPESLAHAREPIGQAGGGGATVPAQHVEELRASPSLPEEITLSSEVPESPGRWARSSVNFWLGILTTLLVATAWSTNLVAKPLATDFGGSVTVTGMLVAYANYRRHERKGWIPVITTGVERTFSSAVLAVLTAGGPHNEAVIEAAIHGPDKKPVVFLYVGQPPSGLKPELFRLIEPHLNDPEARRTLGKANLLADRAGVPSRFVYRRQAPDAIYYVWQALRSADTIVARALVPAMQQINPDYTYDEASREGTVVHLLKEKGWS